MAIIAVGSTLSELTEFRDVFGMRFLGLADTIGLYTDWRVPNPTAPYPQDYIIDQAGVIRYWSDEYDPQEVMAVIDRLLGTGVTSPGPQVVAGQRLSVPSPTRVPVRFSLAAPAAVLVCDARGRVVRRLPGQAEPVWDGRDESGRPVPSGVLFVSAEEVRPAAPTRFVLLR